MHLKQSFKSTCLLKGEPLRLLSRGLKEYTFGLLSYAPKGIKKALFAFEGRNPWQPSFAMHCPFSNRLWRLDFMQNRSPLRYDKKPYYGF